MNLAHTTQALDISFFPVRESKTKYTLSNEILRTFHLKINLRDLKKNERFEEQR